MMNDLLTSLFQASPSTAQGEQTALFVRALSAGILATPLAVRPWRRFLPQCSGVPRVSQAQILMAIVGAVMAVVIGGSPARAFGLVGLGSFVRFRSGLTDPRESVLMLMMIGLGMACGVGLLSQAAEASLLMCGVLVTFDWLDNKGERPVKLIVNSQEPRVTRSALLERFRAVQVLDESGVGQDLGKASGQLVIELPLRGHHDVARIWQLFEAQNIPGVRRIAIVSEE